MDNVRVVMESWPREFAQTLEMMTGLPVQIWPESDSGGAIDLWWENLFSTEPGLRVTIGASRQTWMAAASVILRAAGIEPVEEEEARSTWMEVLGQAASSTAGKLSARESGPVETAVGRVAGEPEGQRHQVCLKMDGQTHSVVLVVSEQSALNAAAAANMQLTSVATPAAATPVSKAMEALLDIQLPVSISFGQARIQLRDVLQLTTGSVVELNRQPEDSVDVIVNDCVVARGEVVVVDGNYAVRIQSIVGKQQRLGLKPDRAEAARGSR